MWDVIESKGELHVVPHDIKSHELCLECWCKPHLEEDIVVHELVKQ